MIRRWRWAATERTDFNDTPTRGNAPTFADTPNAR
jgi:hypothetical protein